MHGTFAVVEASSQFPNTPLTVALFFGLSGAFFFGIYMIRRIRRKHATERNVNEEAYCAAAFKSGQ